MCGLSGRYIRWTFRLVLVILVGSLAWLTFAAYQREKATAALIPAVKIGDATAVRRLLQAGADPNLEDKPHKAASLPGIIKGLLHPTPRSAKGQYSTALQLALWRNDLPVLRLLVEAGADVNVHDYYHGSTPLHFIANPLRFTEDGPAPLDGEARITQTAIARLLLAHGASVNARDQYGWTALMNAAQSGATNVAELLLNRGADVNAHDSLGDSVLQHAALNNVALFRLLLTRGAKVNEQDDFGRTVLMDVAQSRSPTLLRLLLTHGALVNARDQRGQTALMCAVCGKQPDNVRLLLESRANFRLKNQSGATAQQIAAGYSEVSLRLLRKAAAAGRSRKFIFLSQCPGDLHDGLKPFAIGRYAPCVLRTRVLELVSAGHTAAGSTAKDFSPSAFRTLRQEEIHILPFPLGEGPGERPCTSY